MQKHRKQIDGKRLTISRQMLDHSNISVLMLVLVGIAVFFGMASTLPTSSSLFTRLFPKTSSSASTATSATVTALSVNGLHVSGNQLLNDQNQPVVLHGANRMSTEYACIDGWGFAHGPLDEQSVQAIASWQGFNAMRVPLNEDCWLGINGVSSTYGGQNYRDAITSYVNLLNKYNIVAIVDLHWNAPGSQQATDQQPMADQDHAPAFWTSVANTFKGNNAVIFDLYNEPFPDNNQDTTAAWACWKNGGTCSGVPFTAAGMQELVTTVRNTGATNVIMLGGVAYAAHLSQWLTYKPTDPLNNLIASTHIYTVLEGGGSSQCADSGCWNSEIAPVAAEVPVVAGEIGEADYSTSSIATLVSFFDSHNIGYTPWAWVVAGGPLDLITDYTTGAPSSPYGAYFKNHYAALSGNPTPTPTATPAPSPTPSTTATPTPTPTLSPTPTPTQSPTPTPAPGAAPTFIQGAIIQGTTSSTSQALTLPSSPKAGNTIIVAAGLGATDFASPAITDSAGNSYTLANAETTIDACRVGIYYATNIKAVSPFTLTVHTSVSGDITVAAQEYSGVVSSGPLETSTTNTGNSTAVNSGSITTTNNNDLYFGAMSQCGATTSITAGSGYTTREINTNASYMPLATEDKVGPAQTAAATWTTGATVSWVGVIAAFKPSAPSTTPTPTIATTPTPTGNPSPTPTGQPTPTPTPNPNLKTLTIYDDSLAPNWQDDSWNAVNDFTKSTYPIYQGSKVISWSDTWGWGGFSLGDQGTPIDATQYPYISFAAWAAQDNSVYTISFYDGSGNNVGNEVPLANYGGNPVQGSWKIYNIPLAASGVALSQLSRFDLLNRSGNRATLYLDQIQFANAPLALQPTPIGIPTPTPIPLHQLSGNVYVDSNQNGFKDSTESGLAGVTVTYSDGTAYTATTDSAGNYTFASVPEGAYYLSVTLPKSYGPTTNSLTEVAVTADTTVNFGLAPLSQIQPTLPVSGSVPWLKTAGNKIVTQNTNQEVILRGANMMRSEWDLGMDWENQAFPEMANNWKGNVVLRGFASDPIVNPNYNEPNGWGQYVTHDEYLGFLDQYVSLAETNHMYVIFAWRSYDINGDQPNIFDDQAMQALSILANRYKDKPNVLYALQVEPHNVDWSTIQPLAEQAIDQIRQASFPTQAIVMVPGTDWSRDVSGAITAPVQRPNVVYKSHPYNATSYFQSEFMDTYQANLPVFLGEFGPDGQSGPSDMNQTDVNNLLSLAHQNHIGWAAWIFDYQTTMNLVSDTMVPSAPYGTSIKAEMVQTPPLPSDGSAPTPTPTVTFTPTTSPTPTPTPVFSLSGTVYVDSNQNGIQDGSEKGYANASISLQNGPTVVTDQFGRYTFASLPAASYTLNLAVPGGYTATTANPVVVAVSTNTTQNFGITAAPQPTPTPTITPIPTMTIIPTSTITPTTIATPILTIQPTTNPTASPTIEATATPSIPSAQSNVRTGDLNNDNMVNILDLSYLLSKWDTNDPRADLNHDGRVTIVDLSILLAHWGT